jgi:hypothetical protein
MPIERLDLQNAFETTLTTQMGTTDLTALVASVGALASPCVLVIEPDDDAQREYILFDGTFGGTSFVTTIIGNRYLEGSAAGSGLIHPINSVVASVMTSQNVNDIYEHIDASNAVVAALDHGADLAGLGDDDHTQYHTDARGDARYAGLAAFETHDGGNAVTDHPEATTVARGFMSAADKAKLDLLHEEVDESVEDATYLMTTGLATVASVTLTIPANWGSWKCEAYATCVARQVASEGTTVFSSFNYVIQIDGTDQQIANLDYIDTETSNGLPRHSVAVGGRRTGMVTTGARTVLFRGSAEGDALNTYTDDTFLYARAVRTS